MPTFSLYSGDPDRSEYDVIFLHGLGGKGQEAWLSKRAKAPWPTWLADDDPRLAVWFVDYDASPTAWGSSMRLRDRSVSLLSALKTCIGDRPFILVGHSMGGLLIKMMVEHCDSRRDDLRHVMDKLAAVIFMATPHTGSHIADLAGKIAPDLTSRLVGDLESNLPELLDVAARYRDYVTATRLPQLIFAERQKTKGLLIVDPASSDPGLPFFTPVPVDASHIDICKIGERDNDVYSRILDFIQECFERRLASNNREAISALDTLTSPAQPAPGGASGGQPQVATHSLSSGGQQFPGLPVAEVTAEQLRRGSATYVDEPRYPAGAVRVAAARPRQLGVHAAVHAEGSEGDLPAYVPRDIDKALRAALEAGAKQGCFLLLVGGSSVGKTRTAYEIITQVVPDWWLVQPASADEFRELADSPTPRTVVWLDEFHDYLSGDRGITAPMLRSLLHADEAVIVIGTLWPERYHALTRLPSSRGDDTFRIEREVIELAEIVDVGPELSPGERRRAQRAARDDRRIRTALKSKDYGMIQVLAAAPDLVRRWEAAPDPCWKAVITAAVDAYRLGAGSPVGVGFLREAVPGYLTSTEASRVPADWLPDALSYATQLMHGATAALEPVGAEIGKVVGYRPADYLIQYGTRARYTCLPPESAWAAYAANFQGEDLLAMGWAAETHHLLRHAEALYRVALVAGKPEARYQLASLWQDLRRWGDAEEMWREDLAAGNEIEARFELTYLLEQQGRVAEAEQLWRQGIAAGEPGARHRLALLLRNSGRLGEAEQVWRVELSDSCGRGNHSWLVSLLREQGRVDEPLAVRQEEAATGEPEALRSLGMLLQDLGQLDAAEQVWRDAVAADRTAYPWLAHFLETLGRVEESEQVCRDAIANDGRDGHFYLGTLLRRLGRLDEAERVLRDGTALDRWECPYKLADLLRSQGRIEEIVQFWKEFIAKYGDGRTELAEILLELGKADEAEQMLTDAMSSGEALSFKNMAELLGRQGRTEEQVAVLRQGISAGLNCTGELAAQLRGMGRPDEARRLLLFGIEPDLSPAQKWW